LQSDPPLEENRAALHRPYQRLLDGFIKVVADEVELRLARSGKKTLLGLVTAISRPAASTMTMPSAITASR
jgi:hypothetical protein